MINWNIPSSWASMDTMNTELVQRSSLNRFPKLIETVFLPFWSNQTKNNYKGSQKARICMDNMVCFTNCMVRIDLYKILTGRHSPSDPFSLPVVQSCKCWWISRRPLMLRCPSIHKPPLEPELVIFNEDSVWRQKSQVTDSGWSLFSFSVVTLG